MMRCRFSVEQYLPLCLGFGLGEGSACSCWGFSWGNIREDFALLSAKRKLYGHANHRILIDHVSELSQSVQLLTNSL
jgi:hypothetical protein